MRRLSPWIAAGAIAFAASSGLYACGGDDDGNGNPGGTGTILEGGAGNGGRGGRGGSDGGNLDTNLARSCTTDNDCGEGLRCVTAESGEFGGVGPAGGYCTADCSDPETGGDEFCESFAPGALCLNFGTDAAPAPYCVLPCEFGQTEKCHRRPDLTCGPLFGGTDIPCLENADGDPECERGHVCIDGECLLIIPACLPQCGADSDCGPGLFCDPLTGFCSSTREPGKSVGEACTPADEEAGTEDDCRGVCISLVDEEVVLTSWCTEFCTYGGVPGCGWGGPTSPGRAEAGCLFPLSIIEDNGGAGVGDQGLCNRLCDCNRDCGHSDMVCLSLPSSLRNRYRRAGYCTPRFGADGGTIPGITTCPADGGAPRDAGPG
ncbi:MAG TPA: hypothetical protein VI072_07650 [Polyangiaceae bacterium]